MRVLLRVESPGGDVLVTDGPALTISDRETGHTYRFVPGLLPDSVSSVYSEQYEWLSPSASPRSVSVQVIGDQGLTVNGVGEVSLLLDDTDDYADRRQFVRGELTDIGADTTHWAATIADDPVRVSGQLLDDRASVDQTTFPRDDAQRVADGDPAYVSGNVGVDGRIAGAYYPVPIGYPGTRGPLVIAGSIYGATAIGGPGLLVEAPSIPAAPNAGDVTVLIADGPVQATHIRRISVDATSGLPIAERIAVRQVHDMRGRVVSVVTPSSLVVIDSEQWIAWDPADGGGIPDPYGPDPVLRRCDHVIRWALDRSGVRVDWQEMSSLSALSGIQIDTVINGQTSALEWLQSELLSLLPVSVVQGPRGLYIWPWVICDDRDAEMTLRVGEGWRRNEMWSRPTLGAPNRVTVAYAHDARSGSPTQKWTLAGHRRPSDSPLQTGLDLYARRQYEVWGDRAEELEARVICDPSSAQRIAQWRVWASCRPQLVGTLTADHRDERLRPGRVVRVVDTDVDAVAQVEGVRYTGDEGMDVTVRVWL